MRCGQAGADDVRTLEIGLSHDQVQDSHIIVAYGSSIENLMLVLVLMLVLMLMVIVTLMLMLLLMLVGDGYPDACAGDGVDASADAGVDI